MTMGKKKLADAGTFVVNVGDDAVDKMIREQDTPEWKAKHAPMLRDMFGPGMGEPKNDALTKYLAMKDAEREQAARGMAATPDVPPQPPAQVQTATTLPPVMPQTAQRALTPEEVERLRRARGL